MRALVRRETGLVLATPTWKSPVAIWIFKVFRVMSLWVWWKKSMAM